MYKLLINGGIALNGSINIAGSKNSSLPILFASILAEGPITLTNTPHLSDVSTTLRLLMDRHDYCFFGGQGYIPILKGNLIKKNFTLSKKKTKIDFTSFDVSHGKIKSTAYIFNKIAYISDCNGIENKDIKKLMNLKYLIIDCLKISPHPSHFNLDQALYLSKIIKPKKTILTNLHTDLDYQFLKKNLPKNIIPAYDGMRLEV